uniref:Uncharacterized protein n=1 Tax=Lates calcarifer TaxID=8187 RepID=A0A4W6EJY9_LATCA
MKFLVTVFSTKEKLSTSLFLWFLTVFSSEFLFILQICVQIHSSIHSSRFEDIYIYSLFSVFSHRVTLSGFNTQSEM